MSIVRAPRPSSGFTIVSNEIAQRRDLSRRAKGLLVEILSHTDGWRTDAASLADAGPEGRDAIRTTLRELEDNGYLVRIRRQDAATGRWRTDSYVFDSPVEPGFDPAVALSPDADPDQLSTGVEADDPLDAGADEQVFDGPPFAQASPTTGFQSSGTRPSGEPMPGNPTVGNPVAKDVRPGKKTHGGGLGTGPPVAAAEAGRAPRMSSPSQGLAALGRDEHGPLSPACPDHRGAAFPPACQRCANTRAAYDEAEIRRAAARRRADSEAAAQADRAEKARRVASEDAADKLDAARKALAKNKPQPPQEPQGARQEPQTPVSATSETSEAP